MLKLAFITKTALVLTLIVGSAHAAPVKGLPPETKAALDACNKTVPREANGRLNRDEMQKCMAEKGFAQHPVRTPQNDPAAAPAAAPAPAPQQ